MSGSLTYYMDPNGNGFSLDGTLPEGAVACTQAQYQSAAHWTISNGQIVPYEPPAPTLAEQAATLLGGGLTVTSAAAPALNGTYAADVATFGYVNSELSSILIDGTFADGTATVEWPDVSGALHAFDVAQFKTLAAAIGLFVAGIRKCIVGASGAVLPAASATIP